MRVLIGLHGIGQQNRNHSVRFLLAPIVYQALDVFLAEILVDYLGVIDFLHHSGKTVLQAGIHLIDHCRIGYLKRGGRIHCRGLFHHSPAKGIEAINGTLLVPQRFVYFLLCGSHRAIVHHSKIDGDAKGRDKKILSILTLGHLPEKVQCKAIIGLNELRLCFR